MRGAGRGEGSTSKWELDLHLAFSSAMCVFVGEAMMAMRAKRMGE